MKMKVRLKNGDHYCGLASGVCVNDKVLVCTPITLPLSCPSALNTSYSSAAGGRESRRAEVSLSQTIVLSYATHLFHFHKLVFQRP